MSRSEPPPTVGFPSGDRQPPASEAATGADPTPGSYVLTVHRLKRGMASLEPLAQMFFLLSTGRTMVYRELRKVGGKRVQLQLGPCDPEAPLFSVKLVDEFLEDLESLPDDWEVVLPEGMTFRSSYPAVVWEVAVAQSRAEVLRVEAQKGAQA